MRDENRRMWEQLSMERKKVDKLVSVVNRLWETVQKGFPGSVPPFPTDLFTDPNSNAGDNPNIYITSPTSSSARYPPPLSINFNQPLQSIQSPSSSPTSTDFPHNHQHHTHPSLSRQHSFQHVGFSSGGQSGNGGGPASRAPETGDTTTPSSPSGMECVYDSEDPTGSGNGVNGTQNSGTTAPSSLLGLPGITAAGGVGGIGNVGVSGVKRSSRARSDSAPLGPYSYGSPGAGTSSPGGPLAVGSSWLGGRPRSGSGLVAVSRPGTGTGMGMGSLGRNMGNLSGLANLNSPPTVPTGGAPPPTVNGVGGAGGDTGGVPPQTSGVIPTSASSGSVNSLMGGGAIGAGPTGMGSVVSDGSGR
ncbi:hypothetical protein P691DRAFT_656117 [Macrolepiota fuliginosa MF-IS2]|uniref:Uncharacterized protein n=1 Tax=Macrolepiota fuliginosa MF-IS2 TaxID=1400762 RepID=A0A9P5XS86_9AGAR|nr:hypothetical protein P691DRAFT_656117 [Macrolepiota fuliginosa MF-IS2]